MYIPKEDAASPTVSTKLMFTLAVAAREKRHVRCYDIPSAFVNTDVDKNVLMVLQGELAEMMCISCHRYIASISLSTERDHRYCM